MLKETAHMRALITATVLALALTACGGGDDKATGSKAELREAATTFYAAFFEPDVDTVYGMVSERCRDKTSKDEFEATLNTASEVYGKVQVKIDSIKVIDGDKGRVEATTGVPALDEDDGDDSPQWVFEDGEWKSDSCG